MSELYDIIIILIFLNCFFVAAAARFVVVFSLNVNELLASLVTIGFPGMSDLRKLDLCFEST